MTETSRDETDRVPRRFWVGLAAFALYVGLAAVVANIIVDAVDSDDDLVAFALGHFIVLPVLIVVGLVFARRSGWWSDIWTATPSPRATPRRRWLLAIPILVIVQVAATLGSADWSKVALGVVMVGALGLALVGLGEELYFRGIIRVSLQGRHGQGVTVVVVSLLFGLGHSVSGLMSGVPIGGIAFEVVVTALIGAAYFGAFLATGRLWVPIVLHALTDFSLFVNSGGSESSGVSSDPGPVQTATEGALWVLAVILVFSAFRADHLAGRARKAEA